MEGKIPDFPFLLRELWLNIKDYFIITLTTFIICGFLFIVWHLRHLYKTFDHIPGPKIDNFFFGNASGINHFMKSGRIYNEYILQTLKDHGNTVKIVMNGNVMITTLDTQAVKELLVSGIHPKPKIIIDLQNFLFGARFMGYALVLENDYMKWRWKRNLMNPAFQKNNLQNMASDFNVLADNLTTCLSKSADGRMRVSLLKIFNNLALDYIGKIAFGLDLDALNSKSNPLTDAVSKTFQAMIVKMRHPFMYLNPFNWWYIYEVRNATFLLREYGHKVIKERLKAMERNENTPNDILSHIIKLNGDNKLDQEEILDDFVAAFVAGQETTGSALAFIVMCLGRNPDVLERLENEIDDVIGNKSVIDSKDLGKLTYLDMVVKETMRLYPPATATFRQIMKEMKIGDFVVPAGTNVQLNMYAFGRHPDIFEDPLKFDPERFSPTAEKRVDKFTYFPFTLGPRTCLGKFFADMEIKIVLIKFIQRFEFQLLPDQSFDIKESAIIQPKGGVQVTLKEKL